MATVLAFVDFSDVSRAVHRIAVQLAAGLKARLLLIHVTTPDADYEGDTERVNFSRDGTAREIRHMRRELETMQQAAVRKGVDTGVLLVRSRSVRGSPTSKILQEIKARRPNWIVVGSHGRGLVRELLLGSATQAIVRKARCPVVVVPSHKRGGKAA
jgi:nucleotide-binding universal stress UspA family protein